MENMYEKVVASAEYIKSKISSKPRIAVILGSGLGDLADQIENPVELPYEEIPNFPVSTVKGHGGMLIFGSINGVDILAMKGRFHFYEGYSMKEVTFPVYVMKQLGCEKLIVTNACGGINRDFEPGTLMVINDFINLMGTNPLFGRNDERFGPRFPDMTNPYSLKEKAMEIADNIGVSYKSGVYAGFQGPYYETAAEIKMIERMGADAVGMSTVPETIVANYLGLEVLGISCITNMATGIQTMKHSHDRVVETAKKASENFCKWISEVIKNIG